jgi:hypothetical protein
LLISLMKLSRLIAPASELQFIENQSPTLRRLTGTVIGRAGYEQFVERVWVVGPTRSRTAAHQRSSNA